MNMINTKEYVLKTFEYQKDKYNIHLKEVEKTDNYSMVYSSCYLDYLPFQSEMDQMPKATIYKRIPKNLDDKVVNYFLKDELYYSVEQQGQNVWFYRIIDEYGNNITLHYYNVGRKPKLNQMSISIFKDEKLHKVLFYHSDKNLFEDTYSYNTNGKIKEIVREGYWGNSRNEVPTRTFRFEFDENENVTIYSKQLKLNGMNEFEQIYPKKR